MWRRRPGHLAEYDNNIARAAADSLRAQAGYDEAFDRLTEDPPLKFGEWTDGDLAELIARNPNTAPALQAAREVRRREAWQTPARWSLYVSIFALGVSIAALIRTI